MPIFSRHKYKRGSLPTMRRHHSQHARSVGDRLAERHEKDSMEYLKLPIPFAR